MRLGPHGLLLGDVQVPLHAGALHYFHMEPAYWRPALEALVEMGLSLVETYVPWGVHEQARGRFDFGEVDGRRNLGRFLDLAHALGLYAFVRPGPQINAELTYFGLPQRVVYDHACQARSPNDRPVHLAAPPKMFPVPSYASQRFREEARSWLSAVAEVLVPRLWPKGPVVLLQVDNEAAFYFRDEPYAQDYHPDALEAFRRFVRTRYGSLANLRAAWGVGITRWAAVTPPSRLPKGDDPSVLRPHLDWTAFHEHLLTEALSGMAQDLRACGVAGVPFVHNLPMGETLAPAGPGALRRAVDLVGIDYHHPTRDLAAVRRRTLHLAGTSALPFAVELGCGTPTWLPPRSHEDSFQMALCALAHGLRGFNLYMAADRDRWSGAPLADDASPRPELRDWAKLLAALRDSQHHRLQRHVEVALLVPREYARLSRATHALGAIGPTLLEAATGRPTDACMERDLGLGEPVQRTWWARVAAFSQALDACDVPYVLVDSDADFSHLPPLRLLIAPTHAFLSVATRQLLERVAAQGALVVVGPARPRYDGRMRPDDGALEGLRLLDAAEPDQATRVVRGLIEELGLTRPFAAENAGVWTSVHTLDGVPRLLFVGHAGTRAVQARIPLTAPVCAVDALSGETLRADHTLSVGLEPHSCRMLRLEPEGMAQDAKPSEARRC